MIEVDTTGVYNLRLDAYGEKVQLGIIYTLPDLRWIMFGILFAEISSHYSHDDTSLPGE